MIKIQITEGNRLATLSVNADWNVAGPIRYDGDESLVKQLERDVPEMLGPFGHIIGDRTRPSDLLNALQQYDFRYDSIDVIGGAIHQSLQYPAVDEPRHET